MTTADNDVVVVEANGLVRVCAFCTPRLRLIEIHRTHRCTDGICPQCFAALNAEMDAMEAA